MIIIMLDNYFIVNCDGILPIFFDFIKKTEIKKTKNDKIIKDKINKFLGIKKTRNFMML